MIDKRAVKILDQVIGFSFPGLGLILVLVSLYIFGNIASNVMGKQAFHLIERITGLIPLITIAYKVGKQLSATFSLPEKQVFLKVVPS
jgi:uncharacterized membrane protein